MNKIYLDHASTTPCRVEVIEAMTGYLSDCFYNPANIYSAAAPALEAIEQARTQVARAIGAKEKEIYFTSGGSESDSWALLGVARARGKGHIITTAIEHHAVINACKQLEREGFEVTYLPVDHEGFIDLGHLRDAIREETILISIIAANNEIGTIQDLEAIGAIAASHHVLFHTDAVQALGHIPLDVNTIHADLMSLSAHKVYGPKGVGALYVRQGTKIQNLLYGGDQEKKRRPGTHNVPGIVGFGLACELIVKEMGAENARLVALRDQLIKGILETVPLSHLNGSPSRRLANNASISFAHIEGEGILLLLDQAGIYASTGSACASGSLDPSHVLLAIGLEHKSAHGTVRFSLGKSTTAQDVAKVITEVASIVEKLRRLSPEYDDFLKGA